MREGGWVAGEVGESMGLGGGSFHRLFFQTVTLRPLSLLLTTIRCKPSYCPLERQEEVLLLAQDSGGRCSPRKGASEGGGFTWPKAL